MTKPRYLSFAIIIVLVLMFAAARPYAVFADDETPPTPEPTEVVDPGDPTLTEEPTTTSEEAPSPAAIIDQLPEGTDLVVLDEGGEALSLVTEQAAEILAAPDPYFTVGSVLYTFTALDCDPGLPVTPCANPIQAAINYLSLVLDATPDDGNIYVEADLYGGGVTVDGTNWTTTPTYLGLIGAGSGSTTLDGYIEIYSMNAFTLSGFTIWDDDNSGDSTYVYANNNSGLLTLNDLVVQNDFGTGIFVDDHSGNISLINVDSSYNAGGDGAHLDNTAGTGYVDIDSSDFNGNNDDGLFVYSNGGITITDTYADGNGYGAYLNYISGTSDVNITSSEFSDNDYDGLIAYSNGSITLTDVSADGNGFFGCSYCAGAYLSAAGDITVDPSSFIYNFYDGLVAFSDGSISLSDVTADGNNYYGGAYNAGAYLSAIGDITVDTSSFSYNYYDGLDAFSDGSISLSDVTAGWNNPNDCGYFCAGAWLSAFGDITVDTSSFSDNYLDGLTAFSGGSISLSDVTADGNNSYDCDYCAGAWLSAFGDITVDTSSFSYNYLDGLNAFSDGSISLSDVTTDGNYHAGANLSADGDVTVDLSSFSENWYDGLNAFSYGSISLSDVTANSNNSFDCDAYCVGAYLEAAGNIFIDPSSFSYNYYDGLTIGADGDVTLMDVTADFNDHSGASIELNGNFWVGQSQFNNNGLNGLEVDALGQITLQGVTGNENGYAGAYLSNAYGSSGASVTDSVFNGNDYGGVGVFSDGDILLDHVTVDGSFSGAGLFTPGTVTVTCSSFTNNSDNGMDTDTPTLILNSVYFAGNGAGPVDDYLYTGTVTLNSVDCEKNKKALPPFPALPLNEVPVTGGEGVELNCSAFRGTVLILPNGDSALFPCPLNDTASLSTVGADALPGDLPDGNAFGSAFTAGVEKGGSPVSTLDSFITLSFVIPDGMGDSLAILFWDGSAWVDLGGHSTGDGHFEASTNHTGTFMLVSK